MAKNTSLTDRQQVILKVIRSSIEENGYAPSLREIGEAVGLSSPASVKYQLDLLEEKGLINRDEIKGRALSLADSITPDKTRNVPVSYTHLRAHET